MSRYIDANALGICYVNPKVFNSKEYARGWNSAIEIINSAPTVSPDEVRGVGKWIVLEPEINLRCCSICNHMIIRADCNYCPNCGAKMEVSEDA